MKSAGQNSLPKGQIQTNLININYNIITGNKKEFIKSRIYGDDYKHEL